MRRLAALIGLMLLFGTGSIPAESVNPAVISHVSAVYFHRGAVLLRKYDSSDEISGLMVYLRSVKEVGSCAVPGFPASDRITITVTCTDGKKHIYEIWDGCYLRKDRGTWRQILPLCDDGIPLYLMCHLT